MLTVKNIIGHQTHFKVGTGGQTIEANNLARFADTPENVKDIEDYIRRGVLELRNQDGSPIATAPVAVTPVAAVPVPSTPTHPAFAHSASTITTHPSVPVSPIAPVAPALLAIDPVPDPLHLTPAPASEVSEPAIASPFDAGSHAVLPGTIGPVETVAPVPEPTKDPHTGPTAPTGTVTPPDPALSSVLHRPDVSQ